MCVVQVHRCHPSDLQAHSSPGMHRVANAESLRLLNQGIVQFGLPPKRDLPAIPDHGQSLQSDMMLGFRGERAQGFHMGLGLRGLGFIVQGLKPAQDVPQAV